MPDGRKKYLLRIPHELYTIYERWAADEFRSVNAQIEATLVDAARRSGRMKPSTSTDEPAAADDPREGDDRGGGDG